MHIVVIDDNADAREVLTSYLEVEGFTVHCAPTGLEGLQMIQRYDPDLVILDIQLPQTDGWEICQRIRAFSSVPILMVSAVALREEEVVYGLNVGADDYLPKPLRFEMLKARVKALLRRSTDIGWRRKRRAYVDNHLVIDLHREEVYVQGQRKALSSLEYHLLEVLVLNMGEAVPTLEIVEELWSEPIGDDYARYVRIYVGRLRKIIEPEPRNPRYIVTEHGFGYRFTPQI